MEKLKGEEKQVWERAFFAALAGTATAASEVADNALDVWKERCAPAPIDVLGASTVCDECGKKWPLNAEETALAEALPDQPDAPAFLAAFAAEGMCSCGHPFSAHSEYGCHVRLTPDPNSFCACSEGHGRDFADQQITNALSVPCQIGYTAAPKPSDSDEEVTDPPVVLQADSPTEPPQPEEPEVWF